MFIAIGGQTLFNPLTSTPYYILVPQGQGGPRIISSAPLNERLRLNPNKIRDGHFKQTNVSQTKITGTIPKMTRQNKENKDGKTQTKNQTCPKQLLVQSEVTGDEGLRANMYKNYCRQIEDSLSNTTVQLRMSVKSNEALSHEVVRLNKEKEKSNNLIREFQRSLQNQLLLARQYQQQPQTTQTVQQTTPPTLNLPPPDLPPPPPRECEQQSSNVSQSQTYFSNYTNNETQTRHQLV